MNEQDLEKRLRSVRDGPQPEAPQSLRTFVRQLPEAEARRRRGPLDALHGLLSAVPSLAPGVPATRKLQVAAAVAFAILLSGVGAGLLISLRQMQQPLSSPLLETATPTHVVTPRRTTPNLSVLSLQIEGNPYWYGLTQIGNDDAALPIETAELTRGAYIGISAPPYGMNGIVRSDYGLAWDWSPLSEVDASLGGLTSIAADTTGRTVVVGWTSGGDGIRDGRAYYSDSGYTWSPAASQSVFNGTVIRRVVHGPSGWVALGWSEGGEADAVRPVVEWVSSDGATWTRVSGVPIRGTSAFLMATAAGYIVSGSPIKTGSVEQPPFWYSADGLTWQRATATDNTAQKLGPLESLTAVGGTLVGLSGLGDGMSTQLVESTDSGRTWHEIQAQGFADPALVTHVASLSMEMEDKRWLIATYADERARLYVSADMGRTWEAVVGDAFGPVGDVLVEVGPGYGVSYRRVLAFGEPAERLGVWLASTQEIAWP
jgi:hypothetical protein